jgi:hypothetical protein
LPGDRISGYRDVMSMTRGPTPTGPPPASQVPAAAEPRSRPLGQRERETVVAIGGTIGSTRDLDVVRRLVIDPTSPVMRAARSTPFFAGRWSNGTAGTSAPRARVGTRFVTRLPG